MKKFFQESSNNCPRAGQYQENATGIIWFYEINTYLNKFLQIMAQPGMVEQFFKDPKDKDKITAIRQTFAGLWGLDRDDEETTAAIQV